MPIAPNSVKISVTCDFENPECKWEELEPLIDQELNQAMSEVKNKIISKLAADSGEGGTCDPFKEHTWKERTCPTK